MAQPTPDNAESSKAWQWLVNGWHSLRDRAVSAVTYFTPQREQDQSSQRWGVLATDITEQKNTISVELELPGMDKADLSVEVHDDRLVVSGEKRTSETRHEGSLVVTERAYGSFQRVVPLPCEVLSDGTKAAYKNGVLTVTMPKNRSQQPRSIPISRG
jgi:HSP20 family protein